MSGVRVAVLDYGMGNLRSVEKAFEHVGAQATVTNDHEEIRGAAGIVLPGVGAFPKAMESIRRLGLDELIAERADRRRADARHLPRHAAAVRAQHGARRGRPGSGCWPARCGRSTRPG